MEQLKPRTGAQACLRKDSTFRGIKLIFHKENDTTYLLDEKVKVKVTQWCPTLCNPMDCSPQDPLSMEFSRPEYWSG